jgi:hypothetical protein
MMFRVLWIQGALDDMATLWIDADSPTRADITRAANGSRGIWPRIHSQYANRAIPGSGSASAIR